MAEPGTETAETEEPEFDLDTRDGKIAWCRHRAAQEPWTVRIGSMIQDMDLMGIPLPFDQLAAGMQAGMTAGEDGVRLWIDSIE